MALKKIMVEDNGIETEYHRISDIYIILEYGQISRIAVVITNYVSEEYRNIEKSNDTLLPTSVYQKSYDLSLGSVEDVFSISTIYQRIVNEVPELLGATEI